MPHDQLLAYVWEHREADVRKLALTTKEVPQGLDLRAALSAIQARQKLRLKHPEWYQVPEVYVPEVVMVEQSSSPETAHYKGMLIEPGWRVLDLSGGLGADSYAFAKVANDVSYLEVSEERTHLARHNFRSLRVPNIACHVGRAEVEGVQLAKEQQPHLIYIDPDRRSGAGGSRHFLPEESTPNVTTLLPTLRGVAPGSRFLVKLSPMADLHYLQSRFDTAFDTHILSLRREAKELLLYFAPEARHLVTAVELMEGGAMLSHTTTLGYDAPCLVSDRVGAYLYDLYPAFAKVGYTHLHLPYHVWQPAPHTHLYFSDKHYPNFPGRAFEVLEDNRGERQWLRKVTAQPLHLLAKNLPQSTDQLRRQLGICEGGTLFLMAYATSKGKRHFALARRLTP